VAEVQEDNVVNWSKFDVKSLKDTTMAAKYMAQFCDNSQGLVNCEDEVEQMWTKVKAAFNSTAESVLGHARRGRQKDWISSETYQLVDERRDLKPQKQDCAETAKHYNFLCREIRRMCRLDNEAYINRMSGGRNGSVTEEEYESFRGHKEKALLPDKCDKGQTGEGID
jgi:hypothetical protein